MYDASCHSKHHTRMGHAAQVSGVACLVGVQRAVQNVKSEPKYLAVKNPQYVLSTFELFLVLFLLSWLLYSGLTSWFYSLSQSLAIGCVQHLLLHFST